MVGAMGSHHHHDGEGSFRVQPPSQGRFLGKGRRAPTLARGPVGRPTTASSEASTRPSSAADAEFAPPQRDAARFAARTSDKAWLQRPQVGATRKPAVRATSSAVPLEYVPPASTPTASAGGADGRANFASSDARGAEPARPRCSAAEVADGDAAAAGGAEGLGGLRVQNCPARGVLPPPRQRRSERTVLLGVADSEEARLRTASSGRGAHPPRTRPASAAPAPLPATLPAVPPLQLSQLRPALAAPDFFTARPSENADVDPAKSQPGGVFETSCLHRGKTSLECLQEEASSEATATPADPRINGGTPKDAPATPELLATPQMVEAAFSGSVEPPPTCFSQPLVTDGKSCAKSRARLADDRDCRPTSSFSPRKTVDSLPSAAVEVAECPPPLTVALATTSEALSQPDYFASASRPPPQLLLPIERREEWFVRFVQMGGADVGAVAAALEAEGPRKCVETYCHIHRPLVHNRSDGALRQRWTLQKATVQKLFIPADATSTIGGKTPALVCVAHPLIYILDKHSRDALVQTQVPQRTVERQKCVQTNEEKMWAGRRPRGCRWFRRLTAFLHNIF